MTTSATIVFPHQLFEQSPALKKDRPVWLIEDSLLFGTDPHHPLTLHKHKIMLHRASMKAYAAELERRGFTVHYVEHASGKTIDAQLKTLLPRGIASVHLADPVDYLLERRLRRFATKTGVALHIEDTPMFLTPASWFQPWFDERKRYFMADFYIAQRKRMNLLVDKSGKPLGGKWSFDADNRKRWPDRTEPPDIYRPTRSSFATEAASYTNKHFAKNPGDTATFWYPVTRAEARKSLQHFLDHRFRGFGDFEDAITTDHTVLHHSVLTPALNIGLLTPQEVVEATLEHADQKKIALNDLEGFLRQIVGWREFMRIIYVREGVRERTSNFWNHQSALGKDWYDGSTGLDPVDHVIKRVMKESYCHHIERLMVLGNAMLVAGKNPDAIYRWFMELFIDAYDWVMVPNVYGMSQYADGGLITTKPYFSGSNYIRKMSNFSQGPWCETWDGLFWRFIDRHRDFYQKNPRLSMMVRTLDKMDKKKAAALFKKADAFISNG